MEKSKVIQIFAVTVSMIALSSSCTQSQYHNVTIDIVVVSSRYVT
jgi:hypothetical protein